MNIGRENPNLGKIWKISGTLHEDRSRRHNFAVKAHSSSEVVSAVRIAAQVRYRKLYAYCRQQEQSFISFLMYTTCCGCVDHPEVLKYMTLNPKNKYMNIYIYTYTHTHTHTFHASLNDGDTF